MDQLISFIEKISAVQIMDIVIAVAIILFFRIFSSGIAYIIIRMFKFKKKDKKTIKESAFYTPLKVFFIILGFYIAVLFLKRPLNLSEEVMLVANKAFQVISTIAFAKGLASSFTPKSALVLKIRKKANRNIEDSMVNFLIKVIRGTIYTIAGFLVITQLGFQLNGLVAGLGIGGVIITLAAQDTAKNLFGGLVLFLDKPFKVGDWIQMDTYEGTVEDITFRSTRVRTFDNSIVNIPNSIISNSSIINWSKMEKRRYKMNLCIELNTPLEKIERFQARVYEMLQEKEDIHDDSIIVKFDSIKDNGINILVSSYTDSVSYSSYLTEVENINYKTMKILQEEGIELAYDTKTIYMKQ